MIFWGVFQKSTSNRIVERLKSRDIINCSDVYVFREQVETNSRGGLRYWQTENARRWSFGEGKHSFRSNCGRNLRGGAGKVMCFTLREPGVL